MSNRNKHLSWIADTHHKLESEKFGTNLASAKEKLSNHKQTLSKIEDFESNILKDSSNDDQVNKAYASLKAFATKQQKCLKSSADLLSLEEIFAVFTNEFSSKSVSLTEKLKVPLNYESSEISECNSASVYQNCILSLQNNWSWLAKLMKCSEVHMNHSSEYHQFYHTIEELGHWLPIDLEKARELLNVVEMKRNLQGTTINKLLLEIKTALTIFLNWNSRMNKILQQSKHLVPVQWRTQKLSEPHLAISLATYQTKNINLQEGEEVYILDNSRIQTWKVKNVKEQEFDVPSVILFFPGPDPDAIEDALKLTLKFLSIWTNMVKKYGKTIIWFLLLVIRDWTPAEEQLLKCLSNNEKEEIRNLLDSIERTFGKYWFTYKPYQTLEQRMNNLRKILNQSGNSADISKEKGALLVVQTAQLEELLAKYREFWKNWEMYKVLNETLKHPEYLLSVTDWDQYHYLDTESWLKKWQLELSLDDEFVEEQIHVERAKETAEASQLYSSEQEEDQTFIITGVTDPSTGVQISLDEAIEKGVINQLEGKYCNPKTGSFVPIPVAMNEGKIKVEKVNTKKSAEKIKDIGLITITIIKEARPYKLKGVIDTRSDKKLSVDEATRIGILDQKNNQYKDLTTGQVISLADALDSGLLVVEFQSVNGNGSYSDPIEEVKTYAVNAVIDLHTNQKYTFSEAIRAGLINPDDGSYHDKQTGTSVYIGDAIREGYVKAIIVNDPKLLDISPANRISISEDKMHLFKKSLLKPLKALNAFKASIN